MSQPAPQAVTAPATAPRSSHDDEIRPKTPPAGTAVSPVSTSSSSRDVDPDAKNAAPGLMQYELDPEKDGSRVGSIRQEDAADAPKKWSLRYIWRRFRIFFHLFIWMVFTAWWIFGLVFHRNNAELGWLKPTLFYIALTMRFFFWWVPSSYAMRPIRWVWQHSAFKIYEAIPAKLHQPSAALVTVLVFLVGTFVPEETGENTRGNRAVSIAGLIVMILAMTAFSRDWKRIPWHTVIGGMLTQYIIAVFVLRTQAGYDIFAFISEMARTLLGFAMDGLAFLTEPDIRKVTWFLTNVIPAIIFFIALVQALYHVGMLQWFVEKFAVFFFWTLRVSGAEAIVATATPFIGQGESAMLIRPFIAHLTLAELHQIMTCGFATIAGSILVAYIGMGLNPQALVSSCIMSIPASLAVSKMRYPETEKTLTSGKVEVPKDDDDEHATVNALHAFSNGAWLGIKIGATIIAALLCIIALVGLINGFLGWWGRYWSIDKLSLELILGYVLIPVARLLGVPNKDLRQVAQLIGMKIITNEFVAFDALQSEAFADLSERSRLIATYACCGFGNIGSLGIQIGVLSQLAPKRTPDVLRVAVSALICGIIATLTSASIAGMLYVDGMGMSA